MKKSTINKIFVLPIIAVIIFCLCLDSADAKKKRRRKRIAKKTTTSKVLKQIDYKVFANLDYFNKDETNPLTTHPMVKADWEKRISRRSRVKVGARADIVYQPEAPKNVKDNWDFGETYYKYEWKRWISTSGMQIVNWSRFDEYSLLDKLTRPDYERFVFAHVERRRRTQLMQRLEYFKRDLKFDLVILPDPGAMHLADLNNRWSPINPFRGRVIGLPDSPLIQSFLPLAEIDNHQERPETGVALRMTDIMGNFEYGVSFMKLPWSTPYYKYEPPLRFVLVRPETYSLAFDGTYLWGDYTLRFEALAQNSTPATDKNFKLQEVNRFATTLGIEFFPGDGDLRVDFRVNSDSILTSESILDPRENYFVSGAIEYTGQSWKYTLGFNTSLNRNDVVLNPKIQYLGYDDIDIQLRGYHFNGDDDSVGGYFKNNSYIGLALILNI